MICFARSKHGRAGHEHPNAPAGATASHCRTFRGDGSMNDTVDVIASVVQAVSVVVIAVSICIGIWYHQKQKRKD
jgi:hypothetical protein